MNVEPVWIALGLNAAGIIGMLGVRWQTITDHERRIGVLEEKKVGTDIHKADVEGLKTVIEARDELNERLFDNAHGRIAGVERRVGNLESWNRSPGRRT